MQRGNLSADPQHRRRYIPQRRPRTTGIRGNDDHAGEIKPVGAIGQQSRSQHGHHYRGGEVVQYGRKEKRNNGYDDDQLAFRGRVQSPGDNIKAIMPVDDLHDGHRTQ